MKIGNLTALLLLALSTMGTALADGGIELTMAAQEENITQDANGKKVVTLTSPTSVVPGDTIVYTTHYHNKGKVLAENVVITNPVPPDTAYIANSASQAGASVSYSVDGGKQFDTPANLTITGSDGKKRPATADDYTHIRWTLKSIAPDASGNVIFRALVR